MLDIEAFGAVCELEDDYEITFTRDLFTLTGQEAAKEISAARLKYRENRPRWGRHWAASWNRPWYERWRRRRKRVGIRFAEFVDLSNGRRLTVRSDRGFGWRRRHQPGPWHDVTAESLADQVRGYFASIEEDRPCPPEWLVERLQRLYGVEVAPESVDAALRMQYRIEFGPRLAQQLQQ